MEEKKMLALNFPEVLLASLPLETNDTTSYSLHFLKLVEIPPDKSSYRKLAFSNSYFPRTMEQRLLVLILMTVSLDLLITGSSFDVFL
jgi:hypothetical protein